MKFRCYDENEPEVYNNEGYRVRMFFLRDVHGQHCPHNGGSPRLLWDRFDFNLKTHFYSHLMMRETYGQPTWKFGWLIESEAIVPQDYQWLRQNREVFKDLDALFTFTEDLLESVPNARFSLPGNVWYGSPLAGGELRDDAYLRKTRNVSMVSSGKKMCPMHLWRIALAKSLKKGGLVDTYGSFDGGGRLYQRLSP